MNKKFYEVKITEIISTPATQVPKSKVIVELRVREGDEEAAKQRAGRAAEHALMPLLRKKRVEKISFEVTPIDKPAVVPRIVTISGGVTTWFALDE
ncbi:MAG: hypothetical protein P4L99_08275 [Chthoniobacter sp.]|nr:hypothetical protein [Chthoniobacter sp.]